MAFSYATNLVNIYLAQTDFGAFFFVNAMKTALTIKVLVSYTAILMIDFYHILTIAVILVAKMLIMMMFAIILITRIIATLMMTYEILTLTTIITTHKLIFMSADD